MADLDAAAKLQPDNAGIRSLRFQYRLRSGDLDANAADMLAVVARAGDFADRNTADVANATPEERERIIANWPVPASVPPEIVRSAAKQVVGLAAAGDKARRIAILQA